MMPFLIHKIGLSVDVVSMMLGGLLSKYVILRLMNYCFASNICHKYYPAPVPIASAPPPNLLAPVSAPVVDSCNLNSTPALVEEKVDDACGSSTTVDESTPVVESESVVEVSAVVSTADEDPEPEVTVNVAGTCQLDFPQPPETKPKIDLECEPDMVSIPRDTYETMSNMLQEVSAQMKSLQQEIHAMKSDFIGASGLRDPFPNIARSK